VTDDSLEGYIVVSVLHVSVVQRLEALVGESKGPLRGGAFACHVKEI
jgi:hypothetical protein